VATRPRSERGNRRRKISERAGVTPVRNSGRQERQSVVIGLGLVPVEVGALWAKAGALDGVGMAGHRVGAASKRGRTLARPNWLRAGANRVKQARGRVSHLRAELGVAWRGLRQAR
jgi:hypothetical protein